MGSVAVTLMAVLALCGGASVETHLTASESRSVSADPSLTVPRAQLMSALHCERAVKGARTEPVLLPGTGSDGADLYPSGFQPDLSAERVPSSTKLARRPHADGVHVLAETRAEGGFLVVASSGGRCHPTGRLWVRELGGFATLATVTGQERADLLRVVATLDEMPPPPPRRAPTASNNGDQAARGRQVR
jgi:hypothetical protein